MMITKKRSLLVVNEDRELISYLKTIFFNKGYEFYEADCTQNALEITKKIFPDVIVCYLDENNKYGIGLCKILKNDPMLNHIPIIILADDPTLELRIRCIEVGANDCIGKPFDSEWLVALVGALLKNNATNKIPLHDESAILNKTSKLPAEYKNFLYKCNMIIESHINDEFFSIKIMASELGMSHSNLYKKIKLFYGQSLNSFIRLKRLRKAANLLINTNCNVNEAAYRVGIYDIKYFREQFHKQYGMNPSEFIKKRRMELNINSLIEELINEF